MLRWWAASTLWALLVYEILQLLGRYSVGESLVGALLLTWVFQLSKFLWHAK